jgi:uncharacterized sporulation protein YeaH/YhbH (DUF444 family)
MCTGLFRKIIKKRYEDALCNFYAFVKSKADGNNT